MAVLINIPVANLPAGARAPVVVSIPDSATRATIKAMRSAWPDTGSDVVEVSFDLSLDGGSTWISPYAGFTAPGGDLPNKDLTIKDASYITVQLLPGVNRQLRFSADIRSPIRTGFTVETA